MVKIKWKAYIKIQNDYLIAASQRERDRENDQESLDNTFFRIKDE